MAAVQAMKPGGEDDDVWLYGDKGNQAADESRSTIAENENERPVTFRDTEAGELSDEEESDDDIQVTIGDIKTGPQEGGAGGRHLFKGGAGAGAGAAAAAAAYQKATAGNSAKGVDVEAQGVIDGLPTTEYDIDKLTGEDKPWRKPGADITDYFNYGFNEDTWKAYCEKQRRLRLEAGGKSILFGSSGMQIQTAPGSKAMLNQVNSSFVSASQSNRVGPPPGRKSSGTIDVIGTVTSRRIDDSPAINPNVPSSTFSSFPNTSIPPPGVVLQASSYPPTNFSVPPPGLPPSGLTPGYRPPPMNPAATYYPSAPPGIAQAPRPPANFAAPPPSFGHPPPTFTHTAPPPSQNSYGAPVGVYPQYGGPGSGTGPKPDSYYDSSSDSESERHGARKPVKRESIESSYEHSSQFRSHSPYGSPSRDKDRPPPPDRSHSRSPSRSRRYKDDRSDRHRRPRRHREREDDDRKHRRSTKRSSRRDDEETGDSASTRGATNQLDAASLD